MPHTRITLLLLNPVQKKLLGFWDSLQTVLKHHLVLIEIPSGNAGFAKSNARKCYYGEASGVSYTHYH